MEEARPAVPAPPPSPTASAFFSALSLAVALLAGLTLGIEAFAHWCAEALFDPLPTPLHILLVGLVPLALVALVAARHGWASRWLERVPLGLLHGMAMGTAFVYAVVFLPLTPIGLLFSIAGGVGLLVLAPLFSFLALLGMRVWANRTGEPWLRNRYWMGVALALLLLALADLPHEVARVGLAMANRTETRDQGLALLRGNDESALRTLCYGDFQRPLDFLGSTLGVLRVNPEGARSVYYAAYGRPFNALPRPWLPYVPGWRGGGDADQGGEEVGGRLRGLSLQESSLVGSLEPGSGLAYLEWTMEFRNDGKEPAEARAELALPAGAVVSRATLWVDGQEREAAYGGRGQVRQAYERVVARRRDPLLVTTSGPDRVLVQCFPVPVGASMRIKVGLTAPLDFSRPAAWLDLPRFAERNFDIAGPHVVDVAGMPASLPDEVLSRPQTGVEVAAPGGRAWTPEAGGVLGEVEEVPAPAFSGLVVAVDGSVGMEGWRPALQEALRRAPRGARVLISTDGAPREATGDPAEFLAGFRFEGGRDAAPLLREALDRAGSAGLVIWVHAPQPEEFLFEPCLPPASGRILEVPVEVGPDAVRRAIPASVLSPLPRRGDLAADLVSGFEQLGRPRRRLVVRQAERAPVGAVPGSAHLARLWAAGEVERRISAGRALEALNLAVEWRLVTPVSGAVVLETAQQYRDAGLEPVPAGTVPSIPEPAEWLLLAVGAGILSRWRRWKAA